MRNTTRSDGTSSGRALLQAGMEGLPLALQGIGTIMRDLKLYGAGVAAGGVVGMGQIVEEAGRSLRIYWSPDQIHPKPNLFKAGGGLVNVAGAVMYGASSAGVLGPALGGAGAVAQGASYLATQLAPDAGTYYPLLPTLRPAGPDTPGLHAASPRGGALAQVAAMRTGGRGDAVRAGDGVRRSASPHRSDAHVPAPPRTGDARLARRHSL